MYSNLDLEETSVTHMALENISQINQVMETNTPSEILDWACSVFMEDIVVSSSFQTQSVPLLHMISKIAPDLKVLFIDTGFHFEETLAFRDQLVSRLNLNLEIIKPQVMGGNFLQKYGPLYTHSPDTCCFLNKVAPIQNVLKNYSAWISGIRREQTLNRQNSPIVEQHPFLPLYKINPMAMWTLSEIDNYITDHNLPRHPLWEKGFRSIGCEPCTVPVGANANERDGRWPGMPKTECGIHGD
jgi:phosphoadenosine phosphosulfate reductase